MNIIEVKQVTKTYELFKSEKHKVLAAMFGRSSGKKKNALMNIDFQVEKGESVAFLGLNGSGKSTLLKILTGVSYPTFGTAQVFGRIGALLELSAGLEPEFTGIENIYFKCRLLGLTKEEIDMRLDDIVNFADIGEYINQPVRTYSSGMRSRLGFAINVNSNPEILIVDEALSVGDAKFRNKCYNRIRELVDGGVTFLFVTHSVSEAKKFCSRGIVLSKGHLVFDGTIDDASKYYNQYMLKDS